MATLDVSDSVGKDSYIMLTNISIPGDRGAEAGWFNP